MVRDLQRTGAAAFLLAAAGWFGSGNAQAQAAGAKQIEVAVTFDALRANHVTTGNGFFLEGGSLELSAPVYRGFAVVAIVSGATHGSASSSTAGLSLVTVVFGPRFRFAPHHGRLSMFVHGLAGEADGFHSVFDLGSGPVSNPVNGTTDSASSLAVEAGGGIDLLLHHGLGLRLVEADYLRTQLPNGAENLQNNLRLAAGLTFRWGR